MLAEEITTTGPLILALLVFAGGLALWARNALRQRYADELKVITERTRPWMKAAASWLFIATMILWAIIFVMAPDGDHGDMGDDIRKLFQMPEPKNPKPIETVR